MATTAELVHRLRKMAVCVYIATEKGPADDLSDGLMKAADEIERLTAELDGVRATHVGSP